jgi:hypothetical protein
MKIEMMKGEEMMKEKGGADLPAISPMLSLFPSLISIIFPTSIISLPTHA